MALRLDVRLPNDTTSGNDRALKIGEQNISSNISVEFENGASVVGQGKHYLAVTGPDDCIVYGCPIKSELILNVPVAQLLVGILSCQHCSSVYCDGISLRLNVGLYSMSTASVITRVPVYVNSLPSFLTTLLDNLSSTRIILKSLEVYYVGTGLDSGSVRLHINGNSFSHDVVLPEAKFSGNAGRHTFPSEDPSHSQLLSNFISLTICLTGVAIDEDDSRRRHQLYSPTTWSYVPILLRNRSLRTLTFCYMVKPDVTERHRGCLAFLNLDIEETLEEMPQQDGENARNEADRYVVVLPSPMPATPSPVPLAARLNSTSGAMETLPRLQRYPRVSGDMHLPPGWEARLDNNGRMFFVDHNHRLTTWERPQAESNGSVPETRRQNGREDAGDDIVTGRGHTGNGNQEVTQRNHLQPISSTAEVRHRDQFVRRNESFRRLISSGDNGRSGSGGRRRRHSSNNGRNSVGESVESVNLRDLMEIPAVRFLTRPDLLTLLSQGDSANHELEAAKSLFNTSSLVRHIVKHIRRDPQRFLKYQHNRDLVHFLCGMAERDKPLPTGWDVRTDPSGRPFFLDHAHRSTTYIDPRLPLEQAPAPQNIPIAGTRIPGGGSTGGTRNITHRSHVAVDRDHSAAIHQGNDVADLESAVSYSDRVVAWLKQSDIDSILASRYAPYRQSSSLADKIRRITRHGRSALDHYSNDVHVAQLLSFFENDINSFQVPSSALHTVSSQPHFSKAYESDGRYDGFRTKVRTFYKKMASKGCGQGPTKLRLDIRRDHVLEDSFTLLTAASRRTLQKSRLIINFNTEEGLDYGGPQREFFFLISRHLFNPYYGLFEYATSNSYAVHISPMSQYVDNAVQWYRFAGRVIALALVHQHLLDAFFTPTFYKLLLRRRPTLDDLETEDPQFYNSLVYIRDNDISSADLGLTFSVTEEVGGKVVEHELKPGGKTLAVTERNKAEYVQLLVDSRIQRSIAPQARQLQAGFAELLDPKLIDTFDSRELELLIAGIPEIDLDDWRHNTEYRGGYYDGHPVIRWFWMAVERMDNDHRLRLLQFVTGTASLPYEGFAALRGAVGHARKFCIERWGGPESLPRAHTCFNRIDLPPYPSFQTLFDKLLLAINESQSFGIE